MNISVTKLKQRCFGIIREIEKTGQPITITRRGRAVATLIAPSLLSPGGTTRPWERLQAMGGRLLAKPEESVLRDEDFKARR